MSLKGLAKFFGEFYLSPYLLLFFLHEMGAGQGPKNNTQEKKNQIPLNVAP